jgi:hypothetical protein
MRFWLRASAVAYVALMPAVAAAQANPCPIPALPCIGGGFQGLQNYIEFNITTAMRTAFIGVALFMFFAYAVRLLLESDQESTIADVKNAYSQAIVGAAVVSLVTLIVDSFGNYANVRIGIINPEPLEGGLANIILYIRLMVAISVSAMIAFQGVRLILLQGQESEVEQQKKRFLHSLIGVAVVLLATPIVNAVQPGANSNKIVTEIVGVINFLLEILGVLAVVAMIACGAMLVISADEGMKDRAKKGIATTIITLVIVTCSYLVVHYFVNV